MTSGSQVIAFATEAAQGEIVVDFCAGNGGKTLALAAMVRAGHIITNDLLLLICDLFLILITYSSSVLQRRKPAIFSCI